MTALDTFRSAARLVRLPNLLVMALFELLLHYALVVPYLAEQGVAVDFPQWHICTLVAAVVCLAAGGNAINDYFDQQADRINRPDEMVVGSGLSRRAALLAHVLLTIVGLMAGTALAYALRRLDFMLLFVGVAVTLWYYSTVFKKHILVGNIVVALLVALTGYMVVAVDFTWVNRVKGAATTFSEPYSTLWAIVCAYSFFAFITTLGREIIKDLEDIEGDAAVGAHTLAVELGAAYTKGVVVLVEVILAALLLLSLYFFNPQHQPPAALTVVNLALVALTLALCALVVAAKSKKRLHAAATLAKMIMLLGVLSIIMFL